MLSKVHKWGRFQKLIVALAHDSLMSLFALVFAILLRFDGEDINPEIKQNLLKAIVLTPIIQVPIFYIMGIYRGVWRYSSIPDLLKVIKSSLVATVSVYLLFYFLFRLDFIPRSIPILQLILLVLFMGGGRFFYRVLKDRKEYRITSAGREKLIIIGAGHGGEHLFREIRKNPTLNLHVVGFIDDSHTLKNRTIHGIPVLGTCEELPEIIKETEVKKVYVAIPSADGKTIRRIYKLLKPLKVEIKVLPSMNKFLDENFNIKNLERIKIEDLLGREEVNIDSSSLVPLISEKTILVTGAGGSIGSEIVRQLAYFKPKNIIALDISEYNCYSLDKSIRSHFPDIQINTIVGDVRDFQTINQLILNKKPSIVFHAAAYKHVPLMEFNPSESVRTNILGTENVAVACIKNRVDRFVLVSTDKAVNPTNVMGTTKRVAELVIQNLQKKHSDTKLMTVRFGNVLGSSGSVIPLFREQIKNGGPVTVTHPEITRYFMSIPEASKLVIQAGAMGKGGEIFILDMGSPIKIMELAKEMISLSGLQEGIDINIEITGLRPGEKLYEEPLMEQEALIETPHPKVLVSRARTVPNDFLSLLEDLKNLDHESQRNDFIKVLIKLVPEFKPFLIATSEEEEAARTFQ